jgi:hypothetical protein
MDKQQNDEFRSLLEAAAESIEEENKGWLAINSVHKK